MATALTFGWRIPTEYSMKCLGGRLFQQLQQQGHCFYAETELCEENLAQNWTALPPTDPSGIWSDCNWHLQGQGCTTGGRNTPSLSEPPSAVQNELLYSGFVWVWWDPYGFGLQLLFVNSISSTYVTYTSFVWFIVEFTTQSQSPCAQ